MAIHQIEEACEHTLNVLEEYGPHILESGAPGEVSPLLGHWYSMLNPSRPVVSLEADKNKPELNNIAQAAWDETFTPTINLAGDLIATEVCFNHGLAPDGAPKPTLGEWLSQTKARFAGDTGGFSDDGFVEFRDGPGDDKVMAGLGMQQVGNEVFQPNL